LAARPLLPLALVYLPESVDPSDVRSVGLSSWASPSFGKAVENIETMRY
jgi:hypothetical protein